MTDLDLDLDAIEARAAAATEGPWSRDDEYPLSVAICYTPHVWALAYSGTEANAEFIAHARTDVPALVAALREARADCETHHTTVVHQCCEDAQAVPALRAALATVTAERDEARAEVERLRTTDGFGRAVEAEARRYHESACMYQAERDDWRHRYEALRDGVTGLTEDEWGSRADETERCPLCRRKWSKHTDYDGRCYDGASTLAGYIRDLRAVVARVEESS